MTQSWSGRRRKGRWQSRPAQTVLESPPGRSERRDGIERQPRRRYAGDLPLTKAQRDVLELMPPGVCRPGEIAALLGRSRDGVTSSLYALADRELVERVPGRGWRRQN